MMRPTTTDWAQVQEHLDHLLLDTDQQPVNFLVWAPNGFGQHFTKNGHSISRDVDQVLRQHRDAALGFVVNPGGTQAADITEAVALFVEDDSGAAIADQLIAWRAAGLPEPSLSVFTGGKSVHHYWTLAERIAPAVFTTMQRRLIAVMGAAHPGSEFDRSLAKANQVMRVAGSIHPKTGRPAEIKRATGERHLLAELEAALTAAEERFGLLADPQPAPPPPGHSSDDSRRAVEMLRHIDPLQFSSYDDWLKVGLALFNTDQGLLSAWVDWCRPMPTFDEGECLVKWQSFAKPYSGPTRSIASLHQWAKAGGYQEPKRKQSSGPSHERDDQPADDDLSPIDEWDRVCKSLVNPNHPSFEKNSIRRQIRAATAARDLGVTASHTHVRATLLQHQRNLIAGTEQKGTRGGEKAKFKAKEYLINNLIAMRCLTGIAAFNKVGKTKLATELAASLIHQTPFMGNPEWMPAPGPHKVILWWVDQPGADSSAYLKARGLMEADGTLHPQIVALYTEDDDLSWDDQGMDQLIQDTKDNPGAILITDSFFACIQRVHGTDQEPEAGGALIDIQTLLSQTETTHVCLFHSPKETGPVGINAIRGHGSAGGAVSGCISLHFLERKDPQTGKWVADKENPHRRMVFEGRGPYVDLLIRGDWAQGTFKVLGKFEQKLSELTADQRKASMFDGLTEGQKETLEWLGSAIGIWKTPNGVSSNQVAAAKTHPRKATFSEIENTRKQLKALVKKGFLSTTESGRTTLYKYRSTDG